MTMSSARCHASMLCEGCPEPRPPVRISTVGCAGLTINNGKQPGISYNTNSFSTADAVLSGFNSLGIIVSDQPPGPARRCVCWGVSVNCMPLRLLSVGAAMSGCKPAACNLRRRLHMVDTMSSWRFSRRCPARRRRCSPTCAVRLPADTSGCSYLQPELSRGAAACSACRQWAAPLTVVLVVALQACTSHMPSCHGATSRSPSPGEDTKCSVEIVLSRLPHAPGFATGTSPHLSQADTARCIRCRYWAYGDTVQSERPPVLRVRC